MSIRPGACFRKLSVSVALSAVPAPGFAHSTDQAFVLLLPTGIYSAAGTATVVLTVLILGLLPRPLVVPVGATAEADGSADIGPAVVSLVSLGILVWLVCVGIWGARGPLSNPLPLFIWSVWWILMPPIQAMFGDAWRWINPWTGVIAILARALGSDWRTRPVPRALGYWPAILAFLGFAMFQLADTAPDDPARLARVVVVYWTVTVLAILIAGPRWLQRGECFTVLFGAFARLSPLHRTPLWSPRAATGFGLFVLVVLGAGSFDGLNETFWWLARIGINPLEFPGRSEVAWQTRIGVVGFCAGLAALFWVSAAAGLVLVRRPDLIGIGVPRLAVTILPIALGYHVSHYLTSFLVGGQYALAAATDPWATGADWLNLGTYYVTTGFLNTRDTVQIIWLTQAAAVVIGHVWAVILADGVIRDLIPGRRRAMVAQIPLAIFMVAYTVFGLWLLAAPRGV